MVPCVNSGVDLVAGDKSFEKKVTGMDEGKMACGMLAAGAGMLTQEDVQRSHDRYPF